MVEVKWTRMEDGTKQEFEYLMVLEEEFNADLVDRILAQLKLLDVDWGGYKINRYQHSLQSATRAYRDGASKEMVVAALLHDIGDITAPYNHSELAAAILKPYVSARTHWIVENHGIFQGYYFHHHLGGDRNARERFKDHPWYDDCVYFCHNYDQNSFDPDYDTLAISFFEPMVREVFAKPISHMEVSDPSSARVALE
ncbi:MAG TPA: HD domain-containing protein [Rhizobiales bacterium]|nr:HD domain-containing protein [Hyphomicrobiales bacterium]